MKLATDALTRSRIRQVLVIACLALTFVAATGLVETRVFSLPSNLKYGMTIGAPFLILCLAIVERPLHLVVGVTIVAVPFANASTHFAGTHISVMLPLLLLGYFLMFVSQPLSGKRPSLALLALFVFPLFALPLLEGADARAFIDSLATLLAIGVLVARVAAERDGFRVILWAVAVEVALQSAVAIWNAKTGHQLNLYGSAGNSSYGQNYAYDYAGVTRPTGTFNDPIGLANGIAFTIPMLLGLYMTTRRVWLRVIIMMVIAGVAVAVAYALDRASWIGLVFGVIVMLVLLPPLVRRKSLPWFLLGAAVAVGGIIGVEGSAAIQKFDSIFHPTRLTGLTSAERGVAAGEQERTQFWRIAIVDGFLHHPLAGVGIDKIGAVILNHVPPSDADVNGSYIAANANSASTYLQLLADGGLFAATVFVSLFVSLFRDLRTARQRYPILAAGLAGAVIVLLTCWVTDVVALEQLPVAGTVGILFGAVAGAGWRPSDEATAERIAGTGHEAVEVHAPPNAV